MASFSERWLSSDGHVLLSQDLSSGSCTHGKQLTSPQLQFQGSDALFCPLQTTSLSCTCPRDSKYKQTERQTQADRQQTKLFSSPGYTLSWYSFLSSQVCFPMPRSAMRQDKAGVHTEFEGISSISSAHRPDPYAVVMIRKHRGAADDHSCLALRGCAR